MRGRDSDALAVHAIRHAAVPRDAVAEVLDVERALEAGREEPAEGRDKRREAGEHERVVLVRCVWDRRELMASLPQASALAECYGTTRGHTTVERRARAGVGIVHSLQTNTGFGSQCRSSNALTPRSCTGQIM